MLWQELLDGARKKLRSHNVLVEMNAAFCELHSRLMQVSCFPGETRGSREAGFRCKDVRTLHARNAMVLPEARGRS